MKVQWTFRAASVPWRGNPFFFFHNRNIVPVFSFRSVFPVRIILFVRAAAGATVYFVAVFFVT